MLHSYYCTSRLKLENPPFPRTAGANVQFAMVAGERCSCTAVHALLPVHAHVCMRT